MKYLSACTIVRDEAPYISEWIEFHRIVGVEHFYIYDDGSVDDTVAILNEINQGDITIMPWGFGHDEYCCETQCTYWKTPQITAFNHCTKERQHETYWCAFIDVDEYLYHADIDDLRECLPHYDRYDGLAVHWLTFGTSGHKTRPEGLTIENYTRRGPVGGVDQWGKSVKIIAKLDQIHTWGRHGSHNADFKRGEEVVVDELKRKTHLGSVYGRDATNTLWRLNHYFTRSEAEFLAKREKQDHNAVPMKSPDMDWNHNQNDIEDRRIQRYLPELKRRLGL